MVRRLSRRDGRGQEGQRCQDTPRRAEIFGDLPGGLGGVRRPFRRARRSCEGWERLRGSLEVWEGSGETGGVGRPLQRAGRGQETQQEGWEGSGGPHREPGWVGRPSRMCGRSWEALPEGWDGLGGPRGGLGGVGRAGRGWEALL